MDKLQNLLQSLPKSVVNSVLSVLILLSLGSIHYVTYAFAFPSHLRVLLDATFKLDFAANFFLVATFSVVFARYFPQTLLALGAFVLSSIIGIIYYRRGYRRVASPLGLLEKSRRNDKLEKEKFQKRLSAFSRFDARMDNFVSNVVQSRLPIIWYERNKWFVMAPLALFICLFIYVGLLYSMWLFSFFSIVSAAYQTYDSYSDNFRFRLKGHKFSGDDPDHVPAPVSFSSGQFFVFATTCAVIFAAAGPLRLYAQTEDQRASIIRGNSRIEAAIIGSNTNGLLIYSNGFAFIPYSSVFEIR